MASVQTPKLPRLYIDLLDFTDIDDLNLLSSSSRTHTRPGPKSHPSQPYTDRGPVYFKLCRKDTRSLKTKRQ